VIRPGDIGENFLTSDIDLLGLPTDRVLRLGRTAGVRVIGVRNPCVQLDLFKPGPMAATLDQDAVGMLIRKAGVMRLSHLAGSLPGDPIEVAIPPEPHHRLVPV
jgi:MOSC domain-containing protein YiiM